MKYNDYKRITKNGYVVVLKEDDIDSFDTGTGKLGVYEHRLIAREMLGRPLNKNECVHHLNGDRHNNSPDNLLVLDNSQHGKLHSYLNRNIIIPKPSQIIKNIKGCVRCKVCEKPINTDQTFCSKECQLVDASNKSRKPSKEDLMADLSGKINWCAIGRKYGVSDNAVRKWARSYGMSKRSRNILLQKGVKCL